MCVRGEHCRAWKGTGLELRALHVPWELPGGQQARTSSKGREEGPGSKRLEEFGTNARFS